MTEIDMSDESKRVKDLYQAQQKIQPYFKFKNGDRLSYDWTSGGQNFNTTFTVLSRFLDVDENGVYVLVYLSAETNTIFYATHVDGFYTKVNV